MAEISQTEAGADAFYANLSGRVGSLVVRGEFDRAIPVFGTGIGVCLAANKAPGIRAAQCHDTYLAAKAATSNNAQIITFGAWVVGTELAKDIVQALLSSCFDPVGHSAGNVAAINEIDSMYHHIFTQPG